jgi:hypothetical protein
MTGCWCWTMSRRSSPLLAPVRSTGVEAHASSRPSAAAALSSLLINSVLVHVFEQLTALLGRLCAPASSQELLCPPDLRMRGRDSRLR